MYSSHDASDAHGAYVWLPAQCQPAGADGTHLSAPAAVAVHPYDPDTMDALMLFHSAPPAATPVSIYYHDPTPAAAGPYYPAYAVDLQRRQQALARERGEVTRRAMHREVQRRFVKRKQTEFADLRSRARKFELRHRTLLLRAETDRLRDERAWLVRQCKAQDVKVEADQGIESEDSDEEDEEEDDEHGIKRERIESCRQRAHDAIPRKLFDFDLRSDGNESR